MAKTKYPTFLAHVRGLALYMARNNATMVNRLAIAGSSYETDLNALVAAVTQIENNWPQYVEAQ